MLFNFFFSVIRTVQVAATTISRFFVNVGLETTHVVVKIFGNGVKIAWKRQKREGAMCTCGRGNGHMCTLVCCKYDLNENWEKKG